MYLGVADEAELRDWAEFLDLVDMKFTEFREPDIGNQMTALACLCGGREFRKLKLL